MQYAAYDANERYNASYPAALDLEVAMFIVPDKRKGYHHTYYIFFIYLDVILIEVMMNSINYATIVAG